MKKTVKSLIIASSVAAIAGIGAVSFAAWQSGTTSVDKEGSTGSIDTIGSIAVTDNLSGKKLIPFDQATAESDQLKMWTLDITVTSTGATPKLKVALGTATENDIGAGKLYIYTGTAALTDAPAANGGAAPTDDWAALATDSATEIKSGTKAYIILVSTDTADMNKNFKVTVSAEQPTA